MKICCVIGGTGFIGSNLVPKLVSSGRFVKVIGRNPNPMVSLPKNSEYYSGNYGDSRFLAKILKGVNEVIHLAYSSVPKTSYDDPIHDILNNLPETVQLFNLALKAKIKKILIVSSGGTVYGKIARSPASESVPTNPLSPYGITKLACEKYAMMFYEIHNLPVICVRPANAYGEGQKAFTGQGFIASAICSILQKKKIQLYGDTGTVRDYIHIDDLTNGILLALRSGKIGNCYNIGTGLGKNNIEILELLRPFAEKAKLKIKIKKLALRPFDVPFNVLNFNKLKKDTGWEPKIPLSLGLQKTWDWFSKIHEEYKCGF
ncbi:MAG: GDP-mannose 4,6-dehydratase [Planctomycetaceae bacterium]|nr:GDP-mannose 4,6-dehydratase [Planctomycetaceae bacterium]